eukprot:7027769-Prymnesium_polylepis.1
MRQPRDSTGVNATATRFNGCACDSHGSERGQRTRRPCPQDRPRTRPCSTSLRASSVERVSVA